MLQKVPAACCQWWCCRMVLTCFNLTAPERFVLERQDIFCRAELCCICWDAGAMRMLPTGEAIPVPRSERTQGTQAGAAEVEWYEDFVHR